MYKLYTIAISMCKTISTLIVLYTELSGCTAMYSLMQDILRYIFHQNNYLASV